LAARVDHRRPEPTFEGVDANRLGGHDPGLDHPRQESPSHARGPGIVRRIDATSDGYLGKQRRLREASAGKMLDQMICCIRTRGPAAKSREQPICGLLPQRDVGPRVNRPIQDELVQG
jgi:hypothetical protein